jgi:hypothetical protein
MTRFRGPQGRLHLPRYHKACWKGDVAGVCAICYLRLIWAVVRP